MTVSSSGVQPDCHGAGFAGHNSTTDVASSANRKGLGGCLFFPLIVWLESDVKKALRITETCFFSLLHLDWLV